MTSRIMVLVAASLCVALAPVGSASAQSGVSLRASYQGQFLPEGTEIVILTKEGRVQRDGRYQPEFFATRDFPLEGRNTLPRERLGDAGRSNRAYDRTQDSGRLYFIYALTPDSTLYWSYSAQRDSLKYDVISTGVMSVAPVLTSEVRERVLRTFFRPRVTVVMRGQEEGETGGAGDVLSNTGPTEAAMDSASLATESAPSLADAVEAVQNTASAQVVVPPVASASPPMRPASSGLTLSPFLAWTLLILVVCGIGVPTYFARVFRTELKQVRREMIALRDRIAVGEKPSEPRVETSVDRHAETGAALEDAHLRYQQLEEDYDILRARCDALERELDTQRV